MIDNIFKMDRW